MTINILMTKIEINCYKDKPLLNIEAVNCVIDVIHLFFRISDNLFGSQNLYKADNNNTDDLSILKRFSKHAKDYRNYITLE